MKTAYSYKRFSSPEQSHGDSLRRQTKRANDLCQEFGWHLDDTLKLHDLGVSAFRGKNVREGALAAFLEAIKLGKVKKGSTLIVESLDRLSRDEIDEALTLFMSIIRAGVDIATFDPKRTYDRQSIKNPMTLLEPLFIFARANDESRQKSGRLGAAWGQKKEDAAKTKNPVTAACPSWLKLSADKAKFAEISWAVAVVRKIYKWAGEGMGAISITKKLVIEATPPIGKKKNSKEWHISTVKKILKHLRRLGEIPTAHGTCGARP